MSEGTTQRSPIKEEDIKKLLKASEDLMQMGLLFSAGIDTALKEFKTAFELSMKTHFMASAVAEMLSRSFNNLEQKVTTNLDGMNSIYTEGGEWYTFYLGMALGRVGPPPALQAPAEKAQAKAAS